MDPELQLRPEPHRSPGPWPTVAVGLAALLTVLIVAAVAFYPQLVRSGGGASPTPPPAAGSPTLSPGSPSPSFVRPTLSPTPTFASYVVRRGDTLTSIARRFDTTARSIAFWNRVTYPSLDPESEDYNPNRIQVGWTLALIPGSVFDEDEQPTSTPSATPSAQGPAPPGSPSATPLPTRPSVVLSHGPRGSDMIALTFDMGGRLDPAVDIMDWLIANDVRASIFPTGKAGTETTIGRSVLERVRGHPELFELANHSWDHPSFRDLSRAEMHDQLRRTEAAVSEIVGRTTRPWFRPPYGAWNDEVRRGVGAAGWEYLVMWDIDTIDWRPPGDGGPTAGDIEAKVVSQAQGGSIVLMHLGGWNTLEALPGILAGLEAKGLRPVTLSEMIRP
jgi:peptidoglycan/xylan/chitin deacetylase (PgdA/CDA1 family)